MDDKIKVEKWTLEDGRRAERRVTEQQSADGQGEKVVELFVEDERPLKLQQRVVEKTKPVICERKIETIDPVTGNVVEQKIEALEPKVPLQVVDHIRVAQAPAAVVAQAAPNEGDRPVTKQEMIDAIVAAIKANREVVYTPAPTPVAAAPAPKAPNKKLATFGIAEELEKAVEPAKKPISVADMALYGIIAAQVVGLAYILFFM